MNNLIIDWLEDSLENRNRYNTICDNVCFSNIPQLWDYGVVKKTTEKCGLLRGIIQEDDIDIGVIQILIKKKLGMPVAARINRGPLILEKYNTSDNMVKVLELVRKRIPHPVPIVCAPNIENTPSHLVSLTESRWKQWDPYGYETGIIDLTPSIEELRKNFDSKWRNQLKSAEKNNIEILCGFERFEEMLDIYEKSQNDKGYIGVPRCVLQKLQSLHESPLRVFYILNEEKRIIAFDIFYMTNNFGLYFVGWNDEEGRRMYVNNLLLYRAMCVSKEKGAKWLDLGGIDYIDTEENARFKDGMRPNHIRYIGEFLRF